MERTMEWWERDSFEPVDETSQEKATRAWNKRMLKNVNPFNDPWGKKHTSGAIKTVMNYKNKINNGHMVKTAVGSDVAKTALAAGAGYSAYKGAKAAYKKIKEKRAAQNNQPAAANETWVGDFAAQRIMEAYFSEFGDADIR